LDVELHAGPARIELLLQCELLPLDLVDELHGEPRRLSIQLTLLLQLPPLHAEREQLPNHEALAGAIHDNPKNMCCLHAYHCRI
jgi:hypothetical protein